MLEIVNWALEDPDGDEPNPRHANGVTIDGITCVVDGARLCLLIRDHQKVATTEAELQEFMGQFHLARLILT